MNFVPVKPLPAAFSAARLRELARLHGTPVWVYDADTIRARIAALAGFDTVRFAQKANANTHLLRLMRQQGVQVDAVSLGEIRRAQAAGYRGATDAAGLDSGIVFTADVLDAATLKEVVGARIPVNTGSIDMLRQLGAAAPGHPVWLRINPGFGHGHSQKTNTGGEHSKHGIWHEQIDAAQDAVRAGGLQLVGLHMHIGSGADYAHLAQVGDAMVAAAARVTLPLPAVSAGGGLSIPYEPGAQPVDTAHYFKVWDAARQRMAAARGHPVHLELEPGRFLVAESGVLIAEVRATKRQGSRHFTLVDAGFNDLVRPSFYGGYHAISVLPARAEQSVGAPLATVVAGPLCESGDVFTQGPGGTIIERELPAALPGDLLVFHDAGAYGASMSSNYNSRPYAPEVLIDGHAVQLIRRRQTIEELLALETLD